MDIVPVSLGFFGSWLGWPELLGLALIGLLIFGKRLPEVGKSVGKGIVEFKKGLSGIESEVNEAGGSAEPQQLNQQQAEATDPAGQGEAQPQQSRPSS